MESNYVLKGKKINMANFTIYILFFVLVFCLSSSVIASDVLILKDNNIVKMSFSENRNLLAKDDLKKSYVIREMKFAISKQFETKEILLNISPEECELIYVDGWHYLKVGDLPSFTKPGDPQLPVKTFVVKLPKNSEIIDISVISGNYKEILNEIKIIPTPQPLKLIRNISEENYEPIYNSETYNLNLYFPGKVFSYDIGNDNENKYVLIRFYPIQYIPIEKKAMLITDAKIRVLYQTMNAASLAPSSSAEAVIITPPELKAQADSLSAFHNRSGILTKVVTTQYIWNNYDAAPDPKYEGYKDSFLPGRNNITKYNYTLAKKIISFLNRSSNIKYVILFGNTKFIPPSYYIYDKQIDCTPYECKIDYYNSWVPTDYFYISPDYDLIPNYMVGRIPVNNTSEANHFIQKINNWSSNLNWSWFKNVAVAGGRPFLRPGDGWYDKVFAGEISSMDIINKDYFSGMNITKLFRSDNTFNKLSMKRVLSGNYGLVYHVDHGAGDRLTVDKEELNTSEIMALSPNSRVPIAVSPSCMNGAYDSYIIPNDYYEYTQPMSIGESIIKSNAGGIAYIGGSRTTYGFPILYLKNGYVQSSRQFFMLEICSNVFKAYHEGGNSIGNLAKSAILQYVIDNDFSENPYNRRTLFGFVLLGDPALKIPIKKSEKYAHKPILNVVNPQGERNSYFAYGNMPTYSSGSTVNVTCLSNSSSVKMKLIAIDKLFNETIDVRNVNVINGTATYTFTINDSHLYLVKCIDNNGKEGWLYVNQPYVVFIDSYSTHLSDIDDDRKYDYLTINIGVDVKKAGEYLIEGRLCDKTKRIHAFSKLNLTLSGNRLIKLKFDGHEIYKLKMSGYYQLMYLKIYKIYKNKGHSNYMLIDFRYNPYNTLYYHYSSFEHEVSKTAYINSSNYTDADAGINTDNTEHFNYLITNITVYVSKAGFYNVKGELYNLYEDGYYWITRASNYLYLNEGYQTVTLKFNGRLIYFWGDLYKGKIGKYYVHVELSDSEYNLLNYKLLRTNSNYNYNDFERLKDIFLRYYSSSAIDTNDNRKYDYLTFTAKVNISSLGYYWIVAYLYDGKYRMIDSAFTVKRLTSGTHTIQLNFSGWKIHSNGYNGQYKIIDLFILDENLTVLDYERNPHSTSFYNYTSFESIPWKILLVDDDRGRGYEYYYKNALDANGYTYKYWDVYSSGSPTFSTLSSYDIVIWLTGDDYVTTLTLTDRNNLQRYLDAGGKLFISGQDIGYDIGTTSFYQNYLHAIYRYDNKNSTEMTGIYGDYISHLLNINQYGNSPDVISVRDGAVKIFDYVGGSYPNYSAAGLRYDGKYRLVYLPFGFEFVSLKKQNVLMERIIKWLLQPTTFKNYVDYGEDTDGDGLYNYLVINVTLNVSSAGNFTILGYLFDPNLRYVDDYKTNRYLNAGMQTVQLKFDGYKIYNNGVNGRYQLKFLTIENVDNVNEYPVDYAMDPHITSYYSFMAFDRIFMGDYRESTESIYEEGGARYRYLTINVSVNITSAGNYIVSGELYELYDNNLLFVTRASNFTYLNSGIQTVKLNFKGFDIYHHGANEKYYLGNLLIKNMEETLDYKEIAYITSSYNHSYFKVGGVPTTVVHGVNNTNIANAMVLAGQRGNITYRICNNGTANGVMYNFTNETGCPGFNITLPAPITLNAGQCQNVNVSVSTPAGLPLTCNVLLNVSNATYGVWATAIGHIATTLQPTGKANDIFDVVEMLEYLSGERRQLSNPVEYYKFVGSDNITLLDVFVLIDKIVI